MNDARCRCLFVVVVAIVGVGRWAAASKVCLVLLVELRRWSSPAILSSKGFRIFWVLICSHPKRFPYLLSFGPFWIQKVSVSFGISSRQSEDSISILNFFPPNRGAKKAHRRRCSSQDHSSSRTIADRRQQP